MGGRSTLAAEDRGARLWIIAPLLALTVIGHGVGGGALEPRAVAGTVLVIAGLALASRALPNAALASARRSRTARPDTGLLVGEGAALVVLQLLAHDLLSRTWAPATTPGGLQHMHHGDPESGGLMVVAHVLVAIVALVVLRHGEQAAVVVWALLTAAVAPPPSVTQEGRLARPRPPLLPAPVLRPHGPDVLRCGGRRGPP